MAERNKVTPRGQPTIKQTDSILSLLWSTGQHFGTNPDVTSDLIDSLVNQVCRVNVNCQCQRGPDKFPFTGRKDSAEGTLSVSDALRVFTIRTLVATKQNEANKQLVRTILKERNPGFFRPTSFCNVIALNQDSSDLPLGPDVWRDTRIILPSNTASSSFRNIFTGGILDLEQRVVRVSLALQDILPVYTVALLEKRSYAEQTWMRNSAAPNITGSGKQNEIGDLAALFPD